MQSTQVGVVSPCSTCKNYLAAPDPTSPWKPVCPRRYWQALNQSSQQDGISPPAGYLTQSGTDDPTKLANPVYSESDSSVLIWTASLEDNQGVRDSEGHLLTSDILSPDFDTTYTNCKLLPYVPGMDQAAYYQAGAFKEGDPLLVYTIDTYQIPFGDSDYVQVSGFVTRTGPAFRYSFQTARTDQICDGF